MAYELHGSGPPAVFIQGVGACGSAWQPQVAQLSQRFTCLTFDNRGIGASQPLGVQNLSVQQMADDVWALIDAQGWQQAHIVGHSLGGLVAQCAALKSPERVASLALLNTFADGHKVAPLTPKMFWWGMRSALGTPDMRRYAFLRLVWPAELLAKSDWQALAAEMKMLLGRDVADQLPIIPKQLAAMRRVNATDRLHELKSVRALVLSSTHDMLATPVQGRALAAGIAGARYEEFSDASHAAPIQCPERVNQLLSELFGS